MNAKPPAADEPATLQSRLEEPTDHSVSDATIGDPVALLHDLDASGRFHRDGSFGRLFHRGMVSLRENVPTESLHISVDGNRLAAHVDDVSPLDADADGPSGYSLRRAVLHNAVGMARDVAGILQGRQGDHSCVLDCEWVTHKRRRSSAPELLDPLAAAWSVHLEVRVAGALDEARLRAALVAVLCGDRAPAGELLEVVDCREDDVLDRARDALLSRAVDVTDAPPLCACLARRPGGDVLMLNVNGAAADGVAAMEVLHAIARAYADAGAPVAALDFLAGHDLPVWPSSPSMSVAARFFARLVEWLRDRLARTGRLAADGAQDRDGYGFHMVSLTAAETSYAIEGTEPGTERNVLMAALHRAIGDWNLQHGTPGRRLGVLAPANLRPPRWPKGTIGNFSVTARLSTNRRERARPSATLKAINAQRARNKRTRNGVALIAGLQRTGLLSLWAKQSIVVLQPLTGNRLVDTAMLCDLGWMDDAPSFGADAGETLELWFSAPARSPLSLCVGVVATGGKLHLTFRYPHRLFGPEAAARFAACYLEHVGAVADSR
ncbi:MAG TPA: hypothetical protein VNA28_02390 [Solirubrobacteraceae bacterium]|nr:hypothetical protein [Solirubrobacteraceae bacterium]